jgi:hypothetical protein
MTLIPINLATEDELSEVTLLRILKGLDRYAVGAAYRRGGFGYLRRTIDGWNSAARGIPFVVLTDLDDGECPAALIAGWLASEQHPNLLFRIAVREVESWLLASPVTLSRFLGVPQGNMPTDCDNLTDPKAEIIRLARKSRIRAIREGIVPKRGSTAKQGPDYNGLLGSFVRSDWDVQAAIERSPSLARTVNRLAVFNPVWNIP